MERFLEVRLDEHKKDMNKEPNKQNALIKRVNVMDVTINIKN